MKTRTLFFSVSSTAAVIAGLVWAFAPKPVDVEVATAALGPFEATIDEDGKTRLAERYVVSTPLGGRLARMALREGDAVQAGGVVATLTPTLAPMLDERSARESKARVESAQAQWQRAGVRVERALLGVEQARLELKRSEQLAKDGFIAATKYDSDRLASLAAGKELETAVQERHIAEHDLEQARVALSASHRPVGATTRIFEVKSPIAGQVLRVINTSEGSVAMGTPLLEVGNLDRLEVVAELLTTDALRALPGTPVRIERWGGASVLEARVRRVEPAAFTKVSALGVEEQRVNVIIDITSAREQWHALGDGFRVSARLVVLASPQALQVPASAVFPMQADGGDKMAAFVVDSGRAKLTPVSLEARNGSSAWIGKGLAAGTKVIVYPPATVRDGVRVRERKV